MGCTNLITHRINTAGHRPFRQHLCRHPRVHEEFIDAQVDEMLRYDVIEPAASPWASNVVLAKKSDGSLRFCLYYGQLNQLMYKDSYPLPRISACLDALGGAAFYSTMDLRSGFWHHAPWTVSFQSAELWSGKRPEFVPENNGCLLYTSDAADE